MQRVTIIGLGLIGGSIGLGLRRWASDGGKRPATLEVIGFDIDLAHQQYAKKIHAVDRTVWRLSEALEQADLIILATPVSTFPELFHAIADHAREGTVVTDTASTKAAVLNWAKTILPPTIPFVGGHPMAGKTQSIEGADADLFQGATWCVSPLVTASETAIQTVLGLISALGAEPLFIDPEEHDSYVAAISHVPFLLAVGLMHTVSQDPAWRDIRKLTASGFRDATRLAGGSPEMYRDICATNSQQIVRWLDRTITELSHLRDLIAQNTEEAQQELHQLFVSVRDARAEWATQERRPGELTQQTANELASLSLGQQMQQMFLGSLFRRPRVDTRQSRQQPSQRRDDERAAEERS